ncbi:MAG: hypothetical protein SGPRY_014701 [Prymnesium sp.]
MLRQAEGTIVIELLRSTARQSLRLPMGLQAPDAHCRSVRYIFSALREPGEPPAPIETDSNLADEIVELVDVDETVEPAASRPLEMEALSERPGSASTRALAQLQMKEALEAGDFERLRGLASMVQSDSERLRQASHGAEKRGKRREKRGEGWGGEGREGDCRQGHEFGMEMKEKGAGKEKQRGKGGKEEG